MKEIMHKGHRQRMRRKLSIHGGGVFDTYELLEMLLYTTVSVKDTNPLSKRLLSRFGSLSEVLSASREELLSVDGIGEATADMLSVINGAAEYSFGKGLGPRYRFESYEDMGEFIIDYFSGKCDVSVIVLSFDADLNLLGLDKLYSIDYASGGVKAQPFLDAALYRGATQVVVAHNHPYGAVFPSEGDIQTNLMLENVLSGVEVDLAEHYVASGESTMGFMHHPGKVVHRRDINEFPRRYYNQADTRVDFEYLSEILKYAGAEDPLGLSKRLIETFGSLYHLLQNDKYAISAIEGCSESSAEFICLVASVLSRKITDNYKIGKKCLHLDLKLYSSVLFFGSLSERVLLVSIDKDGCLIGSDLVCDGTVSAASFTPRRILEIALRRSATYVILAHNHPSCDFLATKEDVDATATVASVLRNAGITLISHYVVSDLMAILVPFEYRKYAVMRPGVDYSFIPNIPEKDR